MSAKCLLIDDDMDDTEIFELALRRARPEVHFYSSTSCKEALDQIFNEVIRPDIIFLDLNMPVITGKECLAKIKNSEQFNHIPIVIYSTSSEPRHIAETKMLGAHDFLTKPSRLQDLEKMISVVFNSLKK